MGSCSHLSRPRPLRLARLRILGYLVDTSFLKTKGWANPYTAATLHTLPCVAAELASAFRVGALQAAIQQSHFKGWPHPGYRVEEMMRAGAVQRGRRECRTERGNWAFSSSRLSLCRCWEVINKVWR